MDDYEDFSQQSLDVHGKEIRRVRSLGCCIYCADRSSVLTDEHVVPFALGGNAVIFEKACCISCQRQIQRYEQRVLRNQLGTFRASIGAPTRNKKERTTTATFTCIEVDDEGQFMRSLGEETLALDDAPLALSSWVLPPPRILGEHENSGSRHGRPWAYVDQASADRLAQEVRKKTMAQHVAVKLGDINRDVFLRFLAKTAHAYAVSEVGMEAFRPLTIDQILCRSDDLDYLVGGHFAENEPSNDPAEVVQLACGTVSNGPAAGYVAVRLRLYPQLGTPVHIVVVGAPTDSPSSESP